MIAMVPTHTRPSASNHHNKHGATGKTERSTHACSTTTVSFSTPLDCSDASSCPRFQSVNETDA